MLSGLGLSTALLVFATAAAVIALVGTMLTRYADILADRTGLGEAVGGAVLLGVTTSASGMVTSVTAAAGGEAALAYANSLGGIAAQTAFLAVGDVLYRRANLEHAAAETANLSQVTLLILLLTIPVIAWMLPPFDIFGIHPASVVLIGLYVAGVAMARQDREAPMWRPIDTEDTRHDVEEEESHAAGSLGAIVGIYLAMVLVVAVAGYVLAKCGTIIAVETGLRTSVVGALMTATVTSLPELVTTVAAVRRGALQLAVGGIIGGNTFDVLFLSASDAAYREGSIYNAVAADSVFWAVVGILMSSILLIGLIRRERRGPGNIGFESIGIIIVYAGSVAAGAWLL